MRHSYFTILGAILVITGIIIVYLILASPTIETWERKSYSPEIPISLDLIHTYEIFLFHNFTKSPEHYKDFFLVIGVYANIPLDILVTTSSGRSLYFSNVVDRKLNISLSFEDVKNGINIKLINKFTANISSLNIAAKIITLDFTQRIAVSSVNLLDLLLKDVHEIVKKVKPREWWFDFNIENLKVYGKAIERNGYPFNFYIVTQEEYRKFCRGKEFNACYFRINKPVHEFNISPKESTIYFIFERVQVKTQQVIERENLTVRVPRESNFVCKYIKFFEEIPKTFGNVNMTIVLREVKGRIFNAYLVKKGSLYFACKNRAYYEVNISIPPEEVVGTFSLIIEKVLSEEELELLVNITKVWYEQPPQLEIFFIANVNCTRIIHTRINNFYVILSWKERVIKHPLGIPLQVGEITILIGVMLLILSVITRRKKFVSYKRV